VGWDTLKFVFVIAVLLAAAAPVAHTHPDRQPVARSFAPPGAPEPEAAPPMPGISRASESDELDAEPGAPQTHVIYFVPADKADENLDGNGTIARSIDSVRAWFARETGYGGRAARRPRIDRTTTGVWDVTFVRGLQNASSYTSLGVISDELILRNYNDANKRYLIYAAVGRGNICGEGYFPTPGLGGSGRFAAVYLDSSTACGGRDWGQGTAQTAGKTETVVVQEWLHNEGVTNPGAPHHCAVSVFHICTGPLAMLPGDLDPEAPDASFPYINRPLSGKVLDRDHDDYLDHGWPHLSNLRDSTWLE